MDHDPPSPLPIGSVFQARYEVVRCLKAGGMGVVYEAIHLETRRRVALKIMLPSVVANREMHARFKLEATVAANIESEHIVQTLDAGVDAGTGAPFIVMELLRGEDLAAMLEKRGRLSAGETVLLLTQTASALDKTHAAAVVHRDLKPENLFVTRRDDGTPKIKILDFGIAKVVSEAGEAAKTKVLGTPLYMSPEQIRGDGTVGPRADLYALGHIAFSLIVGEAYWTREAEKAQLYALMLKICAGNPETASAMAKRYSVDLPEAFDAWFEQATAVEPEDRFRTAMELVEALAQVLGVPFARMSIPMDPPPGSKGSSRSPADWKSTPTIDTELEESKGSRDLHERPTARGPNVTAGLPSVMVASQPSVLTDTALPKRSMAGPIVIGVFVLAVAGLGIRFMMASPNTPAAAAPSAALTAPPALSTAPAKESPAEKTPSVSVADTAPRADANAATSSPTDAGATLPDAGASLAVHSPGLSPAVKPPATGKAPGKVPAAQPSLTIE